MTSEQDQMTTDHQVDDAKVAQEDSLASNGTTSNNNNNSSGKKGGNKNKNKSKNRVNKATNETKDSNDDHNLQQQSVVIDDETSDKQVSSVTKPEQIQHLSDNVDDKLNAQQHDDKQSTSVIQSDEANQNPDEVADESEPISTKDKDKETEYSSTNDDDGDPIPSGTGVVSRDCSASDLLGWSEILPRWHSKLSQRPKGLDQLVRNGIPEPLRGEVWQLLAGAQQCSDLMDHYRILLTRSAPTEQIILRDVHRTYPAHENFRSNSGSSSLLDSLFKVCKAYAVYDEEVGYCQGLSFLVAALLLHMPEEQAFCVFVRIMNHYGLRDLFRNNFDELYLKFYQLERLLEDNMPDLYQHFSLIGIEPFTYASQWFLTVFTAKFPLNAVFYILDIFLLDGMPTIFQVALSLLQSSKSELLALDFEGVLKYFRVQMPKRYRDQENVQQLILASSMISLKKLSKHAKSYELMKQKERLLENPISRLQRENAKLTENNLRLEQENDDLARDLVASKIQLRAQLDFLEDKTETLNRALSYSRQDCQSYLSTISDMEDERSRLEVEVTQLKEVCRRELTRAESDSARDNSIIADYKKICSQMSKRLDYRLKCAEVFIADLSIALKDNHASVTNVDCNDDKTKCQQILETKAVDFLTKLKADEQATILIDNNDNDNTNPENNKSNCNLGEESSPSRLQSVAASSRSEKLQRKASSESDYANRPVGALLKSAVLDSKSTSSETKIQQLTEHIDELEVELARTKLALVEAECKCQQLTHDLNIGNSSTTTSAVKVSTTSAARTTIASASNNQQHYTPTSANSLSSKLAAVIGGDNKYYNSGNSGGGNNTNFKTKSSSPRALHSAAAATAAAGGSAFSKLNNLISERISNIGNSSSSSSSSGGSTNNRQSNHHHHHHHQMSANTNHRTVVTSARLPVSSSTPSSLVKLASETSANIVAGADKPGTNTDTDNQTPTIGGKTGIETAAVVVNAISDEQSNQNKC